MAKTRDDYALLRNRIIIVILSVYGLSFVGFFAYSLFTFPEKYFLHVFRVQWTPLQTLVNFIENLTPVHCAGVLLACSLFAPPQPSLKTGLEDAFTRLVFSTVIVFVLLGGVFVTLSEGLLPVLHGRLGALENRTSVARNYLELAGEARREGNRRLQNAYLEYYLSVDPDNSEALDALAELRKRSGEDAFGTSAPAPLKRARLMDLETSELLGRAMASVQEEDYYTGYYFADLAKALSPAGSPEAKQAGELAASIQRRLASFRADTEERERNAIFEIKTQAHSDLMSDELPLVARAYYTFRLLAENDPADTEAANYLSQSVAKLKTMAFFRDEEERFASMPGANGLFFLNNEPGADTTELVAIGGIIVTEDGTYARDIEAITFGGDGGTISRFAASAGKIMKDEEDRSILYMVGIDRTDSSNTLLPEYTAGEPQDNFRIVPSLDELELLGSEGRDIASYHLHRLWGLWDILVPYGYPGDPIRIAALMRVAEAFAFIILSLLALTIGWRLRPAGGFPVVAGTAGILILPVAAYLFVRFYDYLLMLLVGSTMLAWGFTPAIIVLIALQFALIVFAIAALAAQSLKSRETRSV